MRAGPNSVLKVIPLVDDEGLVYTKPVIEMKVSMSRTKVLVRDGPIQNPFVTRETSAERVPWVSLQD